MIKFLTAPSPESRSFSCVVRAKGVPLRPRRMTPAVDAPLTSAQSAALASYSEPTFTQGGVPCNRPARTRCITSASR